METKEEKNRTATVAIPKNDTGGTEKKSGQNSMPKYQAPPPPPPDKKK